jgi:hypothetical protein
MICILYYGLISNVPKTLLAVQARLDWLKRSRLARECAKLEPASEKAMAEEGVAAELNQWAEC